MRPSRRLGEPSVSAARGTKIRGDSKIHHWHKLEMQQPGAAAADGTQNPEASIFTIVQEQLGLRLESTKEPVETLVIDHVERPAEN